MSIIKERFFSRVHPEPNSGCWLWTGMWSRKGYGIFWLNKKGVSAHRTSWALHFGEIPDGLLVCHKCDNRACVNPDHLFLGTPLENTADMMRKGRENRFLKPTQKYPTAKLTKEAAAALFLDCVAGLRRSDAAEKYGVSPNAVSQIMMGRTWSAVLTQNIGERYWSLVGKLPPNWKATGHNFKKLSTSPVSQLKEAASHDSRL